MPATQVEVPGLGTVEFPEGVGQEEMTKAIHGALAEKYPISADDLLPSTVQPGQGSPWSGYGPFGNAAAKAEHMEEARSLNQLAGDLIALPGKAAVAIADIPTRISNIGKKPGDRGYTPTLSERGKIIQFPRLQAQQGATGAVAGVVNLLEGTAEGFLEPENAFVMALMPGSGSIAKAASAVWGAQQAAALPESVREAIAVINDPKATLAQKVEAAGQPVVQSYLAQAMVRHGLKKKPSEWQGPLATGKLLKTPDGAKPPPGGPAPEIPTVPEPTPDPTVAPLTASAVRNLPPFGIRTGGEIEFKAKATKPEGQWESVMTDESLPTELRQLARKANNGSATPEETQTLKAWTDSLVRTEQMGVEEHKPAAPAAPEKGAENATRKEREPEHPGTPQGTALPSEREEVRGGEGEPDRNRGGAVGGATGEEAPEVASQRQSDLAALSEWNKTAPMREKADQTPPGFYGIKAMTDAQVSAMSDAQLASNFKEAIRTMKEVAGKRSSDAAADIAKDAKYRLDAAAMYREALKRGLTERNAVLDKYLGAESEAPKALPAPEVAPATETPTAAPLPEPPPQPAKGETSADPVRAALDADKPEDAVAALSKMPYTKVKETIFRRLGIVNPNLSATKTKKALLEEFAKVAPSYTKSARVEFARTSRIKSINREIEQRTENLKRHDEIVAQGGPDYAGLEVGVTRDQAAAKIQSLKDELATLEKPTQPPVAPEPVAEAKPAETPVDAEPLVRELFDNPDPTQADYDAVASQLSDADKARYAGALAIVARKIEKATDLPARLERMEKPDTGVDLGHPREEMLSAADADMFPDLQGRAPTLERVRRAIGEEEAKVADPDLDSDALEVAERKLKRLRALGERLEAERVKGVKPAAAPAKPQPEAGKAEGGKAESPTIHAVLSGQSSAKLADITMEGKTFVLGVRKMSGGQRDLSITIGEKGKTGRVLTRVHESDTRSVDDWLDWIKKTYLAEGAEVKPAWTTGEQRAEAEAAQKEASTERDFVKRFGRRSIPSEREDFEKLKSLEAIKYKGANDEKMIEVLKDRITSDPSKWKAGDGIGWRVDKQINRGYQIAEIDPESKMAKVVPVADTGLTETGGGMEGIGPQWVHVADLVRDRKYDGKAPESQPAPNLTPKEDARLKSLADRVESGENLKGKDKDDYIRLRDKSTQKPPERTEGISAGPGAATPVAEFSPPSIADLIDPSVRTIVGRMPPEQAASTTQPPAENFLRRFASSFTGQGTTTIPQQIKGWLGTISGRTLPKTTLRDRLSGELAGRWVASRAAGGPMGNLFVNDVLTGLPVDPAKFHGALLADNLLSIRDNFRAEAERLHAEAEENGEPEKNDQAEALDEAGDKVNTLLGTENFPFADEAELQAYFRQPEVAEAVKRHRENWEQAIDPLYRTTQNIDPDVELPSRGKYSSARLNLNPIVPGEYEPGTGPRVGGNTGGSSGNISGTLRRKNPFARKAKGTGQTYVLNYAESIANSFAKQLEIASKKAFEDRLVESGNAIIDDPGKPPTLPDGSPTKGYPLIRRGFQNKYIYIRSDLAKEYEIASNVVLSPYQGSMMVGFNRALAQTALAGLTDATVHVENLATAAFQVPGSTGKSLLTDALLSAAGRLDVPITAARAAAKAFPHTHLADMIVKHGPKPLADAINKALLKHMTDMAAIAQMNASRVPHAGSVLGVKALGRGVLKADQVTRMVLNDTFNNLARQGLVKMTETNRREFINQAGNYNLRSQGAWMRLLRQTWLAPFATAGRNFATLGIRAMTLDPGVEASSIKAAAALRAAAAAKWIGSAVLVAGLNYAITGQLMGRKGTKFGSIDTGKDDENGKPLAFDLLAFTGQSRALRTVGARSAIDSARLGLGAADIAGGSARDIANTALGATVGPGPRFAMEALTGYPPAVQVGRASRVSPPGESQLVENVKAAAMQANPIAASINEKMKPGGTWGAAIARQAPRFTLSPGKTADMTEKYPRIVEMAQSREFVDDMIKQARKLPMKDRLAFVNSQVDRLPLQERARARREASRRGVYRYQ